VAGVGARGRVTGIADCMGSPPQWGLKFLPVFHAFTYIKVGTQKWLLSFFHLLITIALKEQALKELQHTLKPYNVYQNISRLALLYFTETEFLFSSDKKVTLSVQVLHLQD